MNYELTEKALAWMRAASQDQREAIDERIAIKMEACGISQHEAIRQIYQERIGG